MQCPEIGKKVTRMTGRPSGKGSRLRSPRRRLRLDITALQPRSILLERGLEYVIANATAWYPRALSSTGEVDVFQPWCQNADAQVWSGARA